MPTSNASFITARPYRSADDLALELSSLFAGGIALDAFNTSSIDGRYARLAFENTFIAQQNITGAKLRISGLTSGNAFQVSHGVTSGGEAHCAVLVESTNAAGCVAIKRNVSSGAGDHLVTITENVSAHNGLRIAYGGSASALYVGQTGSGTYAIETGGKGIYIAAGGLVVNAGGATISAGGLTVSAGASSFGAAVTITSGGANITGGVTVVTGGLTVSAGGLTVSASGATVTGNSTFNNQLTVTGTLNANGGISVSGNISGVTTITTSNCVVTGSDIVVNGTSFTMQTIEYKNHASANVTADVLMA